MVNCHVWEHSGSSGPSGLGAVSGVLKAESPALRAPPRRESRKPTVRSLPCQALVSNEGHVTACLPTGGAAGAPTLLPGVYRVTE